MDNILRVEFRGACAFVPNAPFFVGETVGTPSQVRVLFPNLERPNFPSWVEPASGRPIVFRAPHTTGLVFPMVQFDDQGSGLKPDLTFLDEVTDTVMGFVRLSDGVVISFSNVTSRDLTFDSALSKDGKLTDENRTSLWWLTRMGELNSLHGTAKSAGLPPLSAEVLLTKGHLSVMGFHQKIAGKKVRPVHWDFGTIKWDAGKSAYIPDVLSMTRYIGNRIGLTQALANRVANIHLHDGTNPLMFSLITSGLTGRADLRVVNMELEGVLGMRDHGILKEPGFSAGDPDMDSLYALSASADPKKPVPVRTDSGDGDETRPCAPVAFQG